MTIWKYWKLDKCWIGAIDVVSAGNVSLDEEDRIEAFVKWDGCMNVWDTRGENQRIAWHLCDIDEEIGRWNELKEIALGYFGGEFGIGCLTDEQVEQYRAAYLKAGGQYERDDCLLGVPQETRQEGDSADG